MGNHIKLLDYIIPLLLLDLDGESKKLKKACQKNGNWQMLRDFVSQHYKEDCFMICNTSNNRNIDLDENYLLTSVYESVNYDCKILFGDAVAIGQVIPLSKNIHWVDYVRSASLIIIFKTAFDDIINYEGSNKGFWHSINIMSSQKLLMHPFASENLLVENLLYKKCSEKIAMINNIKNSLKI